MPAPLKRSLVIANNDVVYLWWSIPKKISNCLGFSIHRIVDGVEEKKGLHATVGFDLEDDPRKSPQTTDEWPIQSFNWKDLYAPHNKSIQYKIIPMLKNPDWRKLKRDDANAITTDPISRTQQYGDAKVIFNRGLLSTQALSKRKEDEDVRTLIETVNGPWRKRLGGQLLYNMHEFFKQHKKNGGKYLCALYELTDAELIDEILIKSASAEIILANANGSETKMVDGKKKTISVDDKTNAATRKKLHKLTTDTFKTYNRMLGTHIGHNKFVIYVDGNGKPQSVLTGSTNWTATGLCGQTNNMVIIHNRDVAEHYKKYWDELKKDKKQDAALRTWCSGNSVTKKIKTNTKVTMWYSPNTKAKTKPKLNPATPADIEEAFGLIRNANKQILYLVFNPGKPSIIDEIKKAALSRPANDPLFVRGAVSDVKIAREVTTNIVSYDALLKPDTYRVTGVGSIPGQFSYWETELLKLGFATIHDKIMVVDPFDKNGCAVITGSHNLGYTASYKNDENMLIIRGNIEIAKAYAAHILDVVNHFKWRYKLQEKTKGKKGAALKKALESSWHDLNEYDTWMDYHFNANGFIDRSRLLM